MTPRISSVRAVALQGCNVFVLVHTTNGIAGVGECYPVREPWAAKWVAEFVEHVLAPMLVGSDPREVDVLWHRLYDETTSRQGDKGIQLHGISGVDIALWDIAGKLAGVPVCALLGGAWRNRIPMYASIGGAADAPREEICAQVAASLERGFRAVKIRTHWGAHRRDVDPDGDLDLVRAVKVLAGEGVRVAFDANNGYSEGVALRQGRRLQELGVAFFEEPVAHHDYSGLRRIADALDLPIAAGEQEYTRWHFRDLIQHAGVDILQPDVTKCGGISELRRIGVLADVFGKTVIPHCNHSTIGLAATLHWIAAERHAAPAYECVGREPAAERLFAEPLVFDDGFYTVPDRPGLGLEVRPEMLESLAL